VDAIEFVEVGGKIMKLGGDLAALREERKVLDEKISAMEKELLPLVGRHAELLSGVMGAAMPKPVTSSPSPAVAQAAAGPSPAEEKASLMRRVKGFLNAAEPGTSAMQIAEALKVDPALVREVMRELSTS
jgi:hypothetical protein